MILSFIKYHGTGNDFIIADNRSDEIRLSVQQIKDLCDRHFGVGSDGLILIEKAEGFDFRMNFFNPDASQSFCGNGSRCAVRFAQELGISGKEGKFIAIDGEHFFDSDQIEVRIRMKDVKNVEINNDDFVINTGSPHYIIYRNDLENFDLITEARKIRYGHRFSDEGINVNFVHPADGGIAMRTYERGVEDETLSCGTGVTAAALSYGYLHPDLSVVQVLTKGGDLSVRFRQTNGHFEDIWLCGPAKSIFKGEVEIV